ncbi:hypothetical protein NL676_023108 [Syzygium grande]|nr:hypothetical protein NL676_023108 [Syzygium grande]
MAHSFGERYSTRSDEEGSGGIYGGNDSFKVMKAKDIDEDHPGISSGSRDSDRSGHICLFLGLMILKQLLIQAVTCAEIKRVYCGNGWRQTTPHPVHHTPSSALLLSCASNGLLNRAWPLWLHRSCPIFPCFPSCTLRVRRCPLFRPGPPNSGPPPLRQRFLLTCYCRFTP